MPPEYLVVAVPLTFGFPTPEEAAAFALQQTTSSGVAHYVCAKPLRLIEKKETTLVTDCN